MFCILASKWSAVGGRLRIIFYRPQETFWSLNRDSSLIRNEVIGKIAFFHFLWLLTQVQRYPCRVWGHILAGSPRTKL